MSGALLKIFAASLLLLPPLSGVGPRGEAAHAAAQAVGARDCGRLTPSRKFDEYGDLPAAEETARLERLAAALDAEPEDTKAFVIAYAGRAGGAGEALARADSAKRTLNRKSTSYNTRVNTLDCGRREAPATELWITPAGASPPPCSPALDPRPAPAPRGARRPTPRRGSGRL